MKTKKGFTVKNVWETQEISVKQISLSSFFRTFNFPIRIKNLQNTYIINTHS